MVNASFFAKKKQKPILWSILGVLLIFTTLLVDFTLKLLIFTTISIRKPLQHLFGRTRNEN